ncbi:MAG TPA: hypothetical protein VFN97_25130 [Actinospica sp.]|nr:hypothetical protein [Actinospica sp.]
MTANFHVTEHSAIEQLETRLTQAFTPTVPDREIHETVARIHRGFDGSKVRDFIPLLVENAARNELRALAGGARVPTAAQVELRAR